MQPEISKRCPACGAAIRGRSYFCPHCGKPLKESGPQASVPDEEQDGEGIKTAVDQNEPAPTAPLSNEPEPVSVARAEAASNVDAALPVEVDEKPAQTPAAADDGARARITRAGAAARGAVGERVGPRVEKLRQASTVVLDEAADDPSLRFVLIAAVLFLLFLILLLLSRIVG